MNGTQTAIIQNNPPRSASTPRTLPVSAEPYLRGSRGAIGVSRTRACPGIGAPAIFPGGCGPKPSLDGSSACVAYSLLAFSRLGYSPNLVFDRAYHTTSCKSRGNTNQCLDKKSRGLPLPSPVTKSGCPCPIIHPIAQCPPRFPRAGKQRHITAQEFHGSTDLTIARFPRKGLNTMSNLMIHLPEFANVPPRPPSEPCGSLAAQPCLAPVPDSPRASTCPGVPQPNKSVSAAPVPRQSPRCSVKGCVFPVPLPGATVCRYHELQQSEAEHFQSHQPSQLLLLHAPFGVPDHEPDDSRYKDRKRQAVEREAFLLGEAV